ncbi:MAG: hypothetical protein K6A74_04935 [Lachnospiraceae bacterium]|nr:hypothetical protein [Lachnospiraceae bacterium]
MKNAERKSEDQIITYFLISSEGAPLERNQRIDCDELQRIILLQIYYCEMLKLKVRTEEVLSTIEKWVHFHCYNAENIITKNWVTIPPFECLRLLARMYEKEFVDTVANNDVSYIFLTEAGTNLCKEYLS